MKHEKNYIIDENAMKEKRVKKNSDILPALSLKVEGGEKFIRVAFEIMKIGIEHFRTESLLKLLRKLISKIIVATVTR